VIVKSNRRSPLAVTPGGFGSVGGPDEHALAVLGECRQQLCGPEPRGVFALGPRLQLFSGFRAHKGHALECPRPILPFSALSGQHALAGGVVHVSGRLGQLGALGRLGDGPEEGQVPSAEVVLQVGSEIGGELVDDVGDHGRLLARRCCVIVKRGR